MYDSEEDSDSCLKEDGKSSSPTPTSPLGGSNYSGVTAVDSKEWRIRVKTMKHGDFWVSVAAESTVEVLVKKIAASKKDISIEIQRIIWKGKIIRSGNLRELGIWGYDFGGSEEEGRKGRLWRLWKRYITHMTTIEWVCNPLNFKISSEFRYDYLANNRADFALMVQNVRKSDDQRQQTSLHGSTRPTVVSQWAFYDHEYCAKQYKNNDIDFFLGLFCFPSRSFSLGIMLHLFLYFFCFDVYIDGNDGAEEDTQQAGYVIDVQEQGSEEDGCAWCVTAIIARSVKAQIYMHIVHCSNHCFTQPLGGGTPGNNNTRNNGNNVGGGGWNSSSTTSSSEGKEQRRLMQQQQQQLETKRAMEALAPVWSLTAQAHYQLGRQIAAALTNHPNSSTSSSSTNNSSSSNNNRRRLSRLISPEEAKAMSELAYFLSQPDRKEPIPISHDLEGLAKLCRVLHDILRGRDLWRLLPLHDIAKKLEALQNEHRSAEAANRGGEAAAVAAAAAAAAANNHSSSDSKREPDFGLPTRPEVAVEVGESLCRLGNAVYVLGRLLRRNFRDAPSPSPHPHAKLRQQQSSAVGSILSYAGLSTNTRGNEVDGRRGTSSGGEAEGTRNDYDEKDDDYIVRAERIESPDQPPIHRRSTATINRQIIQRNPDGSVRIRQVLRFPVHQSQPPFPNGNHSNVEEGTHPPPPARNQNVSLDRRSPNVHMPNMPPPPTSIAG
eukprot:jgi/Bigna1/81554/fgenesh1_pg.81_\